MANPKLTNAKPLNTHIVAGAADGVLTAANQISDVTRTTYDDEGAIVTLVTVQDTLDDVEQKVDNVQPKITDANKLSSDLVDDTDKTHKFVTTDEKSTWNGKYTKPTTGIPKADFDASTQEAINNAANAVSVTYLNQRLSEKQDALTEGTGIEISTDGVISAPNTLTDLERLWVKTQVFNQYFTGTITPSGSKNVFDIVNNQVTFELVTKFNSVLVDLDSQPTGWDKVDGTTGKYTRTVEAGIIGTAAQAQAVSGNVQCILGTLTKEITGATVSIYKPAYIFVTENAAPTDLEIAEAVAAGLVSTYNNSESLTGSVSVTGCTGKYVHFIVPVYDTKTITGTEMKATTETLSNLTIGTTQIGRYMYYSTAATQTQDQVTFTIS